MYRIYVIYHYLNKEDSVIKTERLHDLVWDDIVRYIQEGKVDDAREVFDCYFISNVKVKPEKREEEEQD